MLGYLPGFLDLDDPRPAKEQLNSNYIAGWSPFKGFTMGLDGNLEYPNDPPTLALAECKLREEVVRLYQHAWVAIIQPDGSFEVCRMD
jgi:hypothetical protein